MEVAIALHAIGRGFKSLYPYKCSDGGTGRHAALKMLFPLGVRVRVPLGVQYADMGELVDPHGLDPCSEI